MKKNDDVYIMTDCCMWEKNKQEGTHHPHSIELVNFETGQVQYLKSGAKIQVVEGYLTPTRSQKDYNKIEQPIE